MRTLLVLLLCLCSPLGQAAERVLRVGFGTHKPPYVYEGEPRGLEYEIIAAAMQAGGLSMQAHYAPLERLQLMFREGQLDAITTTNVLGTPETPLSQPYLRYRNMAVALSRRQLRIERIADLQHYSVTAFQRARFVLGEEFRQMAENNPRYREEPRQINRNRLLYSGRIDVAVGDPRIFQYLDALVADQVDTHQALTWYPIFPPTDYQLAFHDLRWRNAFDLGLARIRENGEYLRIEREYDRPLRGLD